jgi:DNA-3-methyladenine glycosylase
LTIIILLSSYNYSRGGDSLNVSCRGKGNAVLIKSAFPFLKGGNVDNMIKIMQLLNPQKKSLEPRPIESLCNGQALLCKSLNIKVIDWDKKQFNPKSFYICSRGYSPKNILRAKRKGIPKGRDEDLPYRFVAVDGVFERFSTSS